MAQTTKTVAVTSPMLGLYFGIFAAGMASIVLVLLILEQLGIGETTLKGLMLAGPLALFVAVGAAAFSRAPADFFHAGRRVPAFFTGLGLATVALGGTGMIAIPGALLLIGFDAMAVLLGIVAGFVLTAVLIAPFLRKFGAPSVPAYLARRFDSRTTGIAGASVASAALLLLAMAELKVAMLAASWLSSLAPGATAVLLLLALAATLVPGGVHSLTWSGAAQAIAAFVALLVPATIAAIMITYLPLPQLSHGPILRTLARAEVQSGAAVLAAPLAFDLPGEGFWTLSARYATPFTHIGPFAFVLAALSVAAGIAASPALLPRAATTIGVYETRKSIGWTVFLVGTATLTFSAIAVFARDLLAVQLAGQPVSRLPDGFRALVDMGLAGIDGAPQRLSPQVALFRRDGAVVALPVLMGMPAVIVHLAVAGIVAAALAAASASLVQLAVVLADDIVMAQLPERPGFDRRIAATRIGLGILIAVVGWLAWAVPGDPLGLMLWALALSGAGLFPVLVLSIWWKRINGWGATAGMVTGVGVVLAAFLAHSLDMIGGAAMLAPVAGAPAAAIVAVAVSRLTAEPGRQILEMVRELRIPGGESIADREARRERQLRRKWV